MGPICSAGGAGLGCCGCGSRCCHGAAAAAEEVFGWALEDCCWYGDGAWIAAGAADWGCREGAGPELVV